MSDRAIELKVGILVTVCLALLVAFIVALGDYTTSEQADLFVDVPTSANLKPGAPIKIAGVPAGKVKAVTYMGGGFDEDAGRRVYVRVHMRLDRAMLPTVREDADYYITTQGVLGEKYVEIDPGTMDRPSVEEGAVVLGEPPMRLEIVAKNLSKLVEALSGLVQRNESVLDQILVDTGESIKTLRRTSERIDKLLEDNSEKVAEVIDEILALEAKAGRLMDSAQVALGDGTEVRDTIRNVSSITRQVRGEVKPVVDDARATLASYKELAQTSQGAVQEAKVKALAILDRGEGMMTDMSGMLTEVREGDSSIAAFLRDKELYDDVREMMKDLKRHPWKFIWKE